MKPAARPKMRGKIVRLDYFYDGQIRRYLIEFAAIFQGFQWQNGKGEFRTVPVKLGTADRQVMHIVNNNSENAIISCPSISVWITDLEPDEERRQSPNFVGSVTLTERAIDPDTGQYTDQMGIQSTVERLMPVPYKMSLQVDLWTSNQSQKWQILEQILTIFNPSLDIQTSTNPADWTALTTVTLDSVTYSSRSVPVGTESDIDITSLMFHIPIFINPPAKLKRSNLIQQVNVNIGRTTSVPKVCDGEGIFFDDFMARVIVTPGNHKIRVEGDTITLLSNAGMERTEQGDLLSWKTLLQSYGAMRPAISQVRLKTNDNMDDHASDIVGTIELHPTQENKLLWTIDVDTLKSNTLPMIHAVLDPQKTFPGSSGAVSAQEGNRYLLVNNLGPGPSPAWGNLVAEENDIIEYRNGHWEVAFRARDCSTTEYVLNFYTRKQLKWTGMDWIMSIDGEYNPGYWRLFL